MKNRELSTLAVVPMMLLSLAAGPALAAQGGPMTPELAAKREMIRKQEDQRITPQEKKAAAEALKAERLKIYKARQAAKNLNPTGDAGKK